MDQPTQTPTQTPAEKESIRREVLNQTITLILGGLSLIAALAWNDAILSLFKKLFPEGNADLPYKFGYAAIVTVVIVMVSMRLRRLKPTNP